MFGLVKLGGSQTVEVRQDPVVFTAAGQIINSGSHYVIPLRLDVLSLLLEIEPLEDSLKGAFSHYMELSKLMGGTNKNGSSVGREYSLEYFPLSLKEHTSLLLRDLDQRMKNLRGVLIALSDYGNSPKSKSKPMIRRRGLANFIGSAANFLFGVVDSATFDSAQKAIERIESLSEEERVQLNIHSRVINITQTHVHNLELFQTKAMKALTELDQNIQFLSTALMNQDRKIFHMTQALNLVSTVSYASSAVQDLTYEFNRFAEGLEGMTSGHLRPEIYAPDHLGEVIRKLNSQNIRTLWPGSKEYISLYYKFAEVIPLNLDSLTFLVMLPLLPQPAGELMLYGMTALPHPINENVTVSYGPLRPYLGISQDHQVYITLTETELNSCRRFNSLFYCDSAKPLYRASAPSCEYALFTGLDVGRHCPKRVAPKLDRPLLARTDSNWLYATSRRFSMTTVCPSGAKTILIEVGLGTITLPPKCKASTDFAILPRILSIKQKGFEVISYTAVQPFNVTFSEREHKVINHFTSDPLYQDLLQFAGQSVPMDSMENELGSIRLIQQQRHKAGSVAAIAGYTSIGLVILTVSVITCALYVWCRLRTGRTFIQSVRYYARQTPQAEAVHAAPPTEFQPLTVEE